jgi:hypothetical protein
MFGRVFPQSLTFLSHVPFFSSWCCCRYVALAEIGETAGLPTMAAQQNFVFVTGGGDYVWSGTRWGSAPDQAMDRDLPAWALLAWDDTVSPAVPRNLTRLPVVYVTP